MKKKQKPVLGKSDKLDFPLWQLTNIPVKVDTGAYRSSIDCSSIKVTKKQGVKQLCYTLLNPNYKMFTGDTITTTEFKTSKVKSSNGETEKRYVVKTQIEIFDKVYETEFTLTNREDMKFPVLLGRKLLNGKFLVDTSKINRSYKKKLRNA